MATETEVRTSSKIEKQSVFQPDFKPFTFSIDQNLTETKEPAFEVEKQFSLDTSSYEESTPQMDMPYVQRSIVAEKISTDSKVRLNSRGKIIVAVYSIIVAIIVAFCIYNAVSIGNMEAGIIAKSQIVATESNVITALEDTYSSLGEEENILSQLDPSFKKPTSDDISFIDDFEMAVRTKPNTQSNWFENFCKSLKKLFS